MSRSKIVCSLVVALAASACAKAPSYEGKWVPHSVECFPGAKPAAKFEIAPDHAASLTIKEDVVTKSVETKATGDGVAPTVLKETTYRITENKDENLVLRALKTITKQGDSVEETDNDKHPVPTFYKGSFVEKDGKLVVRDFRQNAGVKPAKKGDAGVPAMGVRATRNENGRIGASLFAFDTERSAHGTELVLAKDKDGNETAACEVDAAAPARARPAANVDTTVKAYIYKKAE